MSVSRQTLQRVRDLKEQSGVALARCFNNRGAGVFSESDLAKAWSSELAADPALYETGWYEPPPDGIIVLSGDKKDDYARINAASFRPKSYWPRASVDCRDDNILLTYASPVCRRTSLIGDFGLSLYRGRDAALIEHMESVLATTLSIAALVKVGMSFLELYQKAMALAQQNGFANKIESSTDTAGTNIGHTIPLTYQTEKHGGEIAAAQDFETLKTAISRARIFVNGAESQIIEPDMAFTIEPRLSNSAMPNTFYHLTVVVESGDVGIFHGFRPIFEVLKLERLRKLLPT